MALNAYLRLVGVRQGEIQGSSTQAGRAGTIMVIAVNHEITTPRDVASGLVTGKRQHAPLVITKEVDRATVPLRSMLASNEVAKEWELQFWRPTSAGSETQHFTIKLVDPIIVAIHLQMPNNKHPDLVGLETYEQVAFSYREIQWTWTNGGLTASDSVDGGPPSG